MKRDIFEIRVHVNIDASHQRAQPMLLLMEHDTKRHARACVIEWKGVCEGVLFLRHFLNWAELDGARWLDGQ